MKIVLILFFVLVNTVLGDNITKHVDTDQLREVINNGWNESNQTLNKYIIETGNSAAPKIIKLLDTPLAKRTTNDIYDIPKILLARDDYIHLFSYVKYLEKEGKVDQVYNLYVKSLKGLKNISNDYFIGLIYRMVISDIIAKSLKQSISSNFFTKDKRQLLKHDLLPLLVTNNELLLRTLENEKLYTLKVIKNMQLTDVPSLIDKNHFRFYKKYFIASVNEDYSKLFDAIIANNLDELEKNKEVRREDHYKISKIISMLLLKLKLKFYNFLSIDNENSDYITLAKYMVEEEMLIYTPSLNRTYNDYFELVKENKKLLEILD